RLCTRVHYHVFQVMDDFTDLLANGRSTRFACGKNDVSFFAQIFHEMGNVRGLARAFRSFESDEHEESIQVDRYKCKQVNKCIATCLPVCTNIFMYLRFRAYSLKILTCLRGSLPYE